MEEVAGDALELELTVDLRRTNAHRLGAAVRVSGDGRGARVWYEPSANLIGVDRLLGPEQVYANAAATRRGDLQGAVEKLQASQVAAPAGTVHGESGTVTLRIFVDRSILEMYCGGAALTDRLYPEPSATGVHLFAEAGVAHASTVSVWPLRGSWQPGEFCSTGSGWLVDAQRHAMQYAGVNHEKVTIRERLVTICSRRTNWPSTILGPR